MSSTPSHSLPTAVLTRNDSPQGAEIASKKHSPVFDVTFEGVLWEEIRSSTGAGEPTTRDGKRVITLDLASSYIIRIPVQTQQGGSPPPTPRSPIESKTPHETKNDIESILKRSVNNFENNVNILMSELYKVAKTHPVIKDILSYFKAGLELELAWPKHNYRTIALNLTMWSMMIVKLREVVDIDKSDKDDIICSIKLCAKVCDSYRKQHVIAKYFVRDHWRVKFSEVVQRFAVHTAKIPTPGSGTALDTMQTDIGRFTDPKNISDFMDAIFHPVESQEPEEKEIASFFEKKSTTIEAVLQDDALLNNLLAVLESKFGKAVSYHGSSTEKDETKTMLRQLGTNKNVVEQVLIDNIYFSKKFEFVFQRQTDETAMSIIAHHGTDSDTQEIIDSDIRRVWTQNQKDWKDSVEAKSLVMALCDYFESGDGAGNLVAEDKWDLQCIRRDVSGSQAKQRSVKESDLSLITVSEVNAFTAARPRAWRLLRWISYWTSQYGFETTLQWYLHRIHNVMVEIQDSSTGNLNSNKSTQGNLHSDNSTQGNLHSDNSTQAKKTRICVESISKAMGFLSKLRDDKQRGGNINWEDDYRFCKFKNDVLKENEEQMDQSLRMLNYKLDTQIKLIIVAEEDRPEKYNLPLILHLGIKARNILKQVGNLSTQDLETLDAIVNSLLILAPSSELQAKLQNQNKRDFLSKLCFALYQIRSTASENTNPGDPVLPPPKEQNDVHILPVSGEAAETSKSPN